MNEKDLSNAQNIGELSEKELKDVSGGRYAIWTPEPFAVFQPQRMNCRQNTSWTCMKCGCTESAAYDFDINSIPEQLHNLVPKDVANYRYCTGCRGMAACCCCVDFQLNTMMCNYYINH